MTWSHLTIAPDLSHHVFKDGFPAYDNRFDEVLKFHEPGLAPVRRGGEAWHIQANGHSAYDRRFMETFGFYERFAAVSGEDGWHHIKTSGEDAYRERYEWCGNFQGMLCTVRAMDGMYFHIDCRGFPSYAARWHYAGDYRDEIAVVQAENGRSTHIDNLGYQIHGKWYIDLDVFHKGFARAKDDAGWTHVDRCGDPVYNRRFLSVEPFYNGQARVELFDGALEIINSAGTTITQIRPPLNTKFNDF